MRKGKQLSFKSEEQIALLEEQALALGCSNLSGLVQAIAERDRQVIRGVGVDCANLPAISCLYFCYSPSQELLSIGGTGNLRERWRQELQRRSGVYQDVDQWYLGWIPCPEDIHPHLEPLLINLLKPPLNEGVTSSGEQGERWQIRLMVRLFGCSSAAELFNKIVGGRLLPTRSRIPLTDETEAIFYQNLGNFYAAKDQQSGFVVTYKSARGEHQQFLCHYGETQIREGRAYLDVWTEEENDHPDLPELSHNRSLRIDRIVSISQTSAPWRKHGLDFIEVEIELYGPLASGSYEPRPDDSSSHLIEEEDDCLHSDTPLPRRLVVRRRVYGLVWFLHEILRYGGNCQVIAPAPVRAAVAQESLKMAKHYRDEPAAVCTT